MLFDAESLAGLLHLHRYHNIEVLGLGCDSLIVFSVGIKARVVGILHILSGMAGICGCIDTSLYERGRKLVDRIIFSGKVNHRASLTLGSHHIKARHSGCLGHLGVVGTECRSDMHDTRAVLGRNIVARNYTESLIGKFHESIAAGGKCLVGMCGGIPAHKLRRQMVHLLARLHPRHQLTVTHADKVGGGIYGCHSVRNHLVAGRVYHLGLGTFGLEVCGHTVFCHDGRNLVACIGVESAHKGILNLGTHTQSGVRG